MPLMPDYIAKRTWGIRPFTGDQEQMLTDIRTVEPTMADCRIAMIANRVLTNDIFSPLINWRGGLVDIRTAVAFPIIREIIIPKEHNT